MTNAVVNSKIHNMCFAAGTYKQDRETTYKSHFTIQKMKLWLQNFKYVLCQIELFTFNALNT